MKFANLLQTRLEAIGSRLSEVQTKNFLWGFVKNTLVWHNAQGRGAEKQRWRERRVDIRDFLNFSKYLARARARARAPAWSSYSYNSGRGRGRGRGRG